MSSAASPDNAAGNVIFRSAVAVDLSAIIALLADDDLGQTREDTSAAAHHQYFEAFEAIRMDANNDIVVADKNGKVAGCLQLTFIPGLSFKGSTRAQIESVRVAADERGQNIGRRMIEHAIEKTRNRGAVMVQLTSNAARTDALRFYESLGFEATHAGMKLVL